MLTLRGLSPVVNSSQNVREDLIAKAVDFLRHPKVADTPVSQKMMFLKEQKGLTPQEIAVVLEKAGLKSSTPTAATSSASPTSTDFFRPSLANRAVAPPEGWGVGAVLLTAGLAAVVGGALVWMGNQWINAVWGTDDDDHVAASPAATPSSAKKRRRKKKKKQQMEEVSELKEAFTVAFQEQARQNSELFVSVQGLLDQVSENNKLRAESYRVTSASGTMSDETAKNDLQTIKQLLLTRQISATPPSAPATAAAAATSAQPSGISIPSKPALPAFMQESPAPAASAPAPAVSTPVASPGIVIPSKPALPAFMQETTQSPAPSDDKGKPGQTGTILGPMDDVTSTADSSSK